MMLRILNGVLQSAETTINHPNGNVSAIHADLLDWKDVPAVSSKSVTPPLIVTRHPNLVEWLRLRGIYGEVVEQATPEIVSGRHVYGVLPHYLSVLTQTYTEVSMPLLTLAQRREMGQRDLSLDEMDKAGATMDTYVVRHKAEFTTDYIMCEHERQERGDDV